MESKGINGLSWVTCLVAVLCNLFHKAFFFHFLQYGWMLDLNTETGIVIQELD